MSRLTLPYDIQHLILNYLSLSPAPPLALAVPSSSSQEWDTINRSALCAYALASRAFKADAYALIFSSVVLEVALFPKHTLKNALERISQFAHILSPADNFNYTSIARCIKSFTLIINLPPLSHKDNLRAFLQDDSLRTIFDALHGSDYGIDSFSIIRVTSTAELRVAYTDIIPRTRRSFEILMRSPTLKHVQLDGLSKIPRTLFCGTHVKHAEFYSIRLEQAGGEDASKALNLQEWQPPMLVSVGLDGAFPLFSFLAHRNGDAGDPPCQVQVLEKIKEIHCRLISFTSVPEIIDIATCASGSLQKLYIQISGPGFPLSTPPEVHISHTDKGYGFHLLRHLSSLRISVNSCVYFNQPNSVYPFFHILQQSTFPDTLHEIRFDITTHHRHHTLGPDSLAILPSETLINRADWLKVNALLGSAMFSHVQKIIIVINYHVTVEVISKPSFDSAVFGARARKELESVLSIFTDASGALGPRRGGSVDVTVTTHDLETVGAIVPYRKGFSMRCGGRRSGSVPLYGSA